MRLLLDTSVLLSASGSSKGASREVFRIATANEWTLLASPYILHEVNRNLALLPSEATRYWQILRSELVIVPDILVLDRPTYFNVSKDRPVLYTALAWADVLLTLDKADFATLLDTRFYGLAVFKPGVFLEHQRATGLLR